MLYKNHNILKIWNYFTMKLLLCFTRILFHALRSIYDLYSSFSFALQLPFMVVGQKVANMVQWEITLFTCACCLNSMFWWGFHSIHALSTSFCMPNVFFSCLWSVMGESVLHGRLLFLPTLLHDEMSPVCCFIMFILYWSCLFPCDTHTGLLAWSYRI